MQTDLLSIIDLTGSPRQRGRIHGESLRAQIHGLIALHRQFISDFFGVDPDVYLARFRDHGDFGPALRRWAPDLLDEVAGMAEGADIDFESMLQHQLIDEEWAFGFYHWRPVVERNKCSAFAVAAEAGHPAFAGQNMDVPRYIDGGQVLFRITEPDSGRVSYVFSYAGLIGLCGMNNAPIGITCNTLNQLRPSRTGLPVAFIVRQVLSCGSVEEARAFVRFIDHASGQNFIVSGRDGAHCFECSAGKVVEFAGEAGGRRLCHTNHVLANDDVGDFDLLMRALPEGERLHFSNSKQRYASINGRLGDPSRPVDLAAVKAALSAHDDPQNPVSRTYNDTHGSYIGFTAGSLIYDYGAPPRLHVASGPPCSTTYRTFALPEREG